MTPLNPVAVLGNAGALRLRMAFPTAVVVVAPTSAPSGGGRYSYLRGETYTPPPPPKKKKKDETPPVIDPWIAHLEEMQRLERERLHALTVIALLKR